MGKKTRKAPAGADQARLFAFLHKLTKDHWATKHLTHGASYEIGCSVKAKIDGRAVKLDSGFDPIAGQLTVGHPSERNSSKTAPTAQIIAALLPYVPKTRRAEMLAQLAAHWQANGTLPVEEADVQEGQVWLKTLKLSTVQQVGAPVSAMLMGE